MASSLAGFVGSLDKSTVKLTTRTFGKNTDLLTRKGTLPYEYLDSFESSLPPIESFYSKLNDENVSEKDYKFEKMSGQKGFAKTWEIVMTYILKLM